MNKRPVLRYHGGKWKLAPWIISHFPPHRIYVEPYGGGGSVLMQKQRSYSEVYNDLWGVVVNVFRVLRDPSQAAELERVIRLTPFAREEFEATGDEILSQIADPIELARRTIFRSFAGFGSAATNAKYATGFRSNSSRSGTTPAHDWAHYPDALPAIIERLAGVVIENRAAVEVIRQHDGLDTLHYVDPPYVHSTRKERQSKNYRHEMTDAQHRELANVLHNTRGMVVLSGYDCELYRELYGDWARYDRSTFADGASARVESLWLSPAAEVARNTLFSMAAQP